MLEIRRSLNRNYTLRISKLLIILIWIGYILSIFSAYPKYQIERYNDPFAMLNSLYPMYYFILIGTVVFCSLMLFYTKKIKLWIYIVIIIQLSISLWWTPFYMSAYTRWPDTLWHVGASRYIQTTLSNQSLGAAASSILWYSKYYPCSFLLHDMLIKITNIDSLIYANIIYPALCCIGTSLLIFVLASQFLSQRNSILATMACILGMNYFEVHPSPHSVGTILTLTFLTLFLYSDIKSHAIALLVGIVLILTHPISPLIVLIFLLSFYITYKKNQHTINNIVVIALGWLLWSINFQTQGSMTYKQILIAIENILTLQFIYKFKNVITITIGTMATEYHYLEYFNLASTYSFFIIAIILFINHLFTIFIQYRKSKEKLNIVNILKSIKGEQKFLLVVTFFYLAAIKIWASILGGIIERFLSYAIIFTTFYINKFINLRCNVHTTFHYKALVIAWIVFLTIANSLVSYGTIAPSIYPPSEGNGLQFLAYHCNLSYKSISMPFFQQLVFYADPRLQYHEKIFPPELSDLPNIIVFRKSYYFLDSMYVSNNSNLIRSNNLIQSNPLSQKIYSSSTFIIYITNKDK